MCGLVSCFSLHPSNPAPCLQQQPTPSASEAHISCLQAETRIPFYLPCKSTDVWNVSKCTQPSLGFRHSFSLDDLLGIFIPFAFQADKLSFCSCTQELPPPHSFKPMCHGQHICIATSAMSQMLRPIARQILISIWKVLCCDILMHGSRPHRPFVIWRRKAASWRAKTHELWVSGDLIWTVNPCVILVFLSMGLNFSLCEMSWLNSLRGLYVFKVL